MSVCVKVGHGLHVSICDSTAAGAKPRPGARQASCHLVRDLQRPLGVVFFMSSLHGGRARSGWASAEDVSAFWSRCPALGSAPAAQEGSAWVSPACWPPTGWPCPDFPGTVAALGFGVCGGRVNLERRLFGEVWSHVTVLGGALGLAQQWAGHRLSSPSLTSCPSAQTSLKLLKEHTVGGYARCIPQK